MWNDTSIVQRNQSFEHIEAFVSFHLFSNIKAKSFSQNLNIFRTLSVLDSQLEFSDTSVNTNSSENPVIFGAKILLHFRHII